MAASCLLCSIVRKEDRASHTRTAEEVENMKGKGEGRKKWWEEKGGRRKGGGGKEEKGDE